MKPVLPQPHTSPLTFASTLGGRLSSELGSCVYVRLTSSGSVTGRRQWGRLYYVLEV